MLRPVGNKRESTSKAVHFQDDSELIANRAYQDKMEAA